jgi:flagellum-specific ATP synthase
MSISFADNLHQYIQGVQQSTTVCMHGSITRVTGLAMESIGPLARLGEVCMVYNNVTQPLETEVVGFSGDKVILLALGDMKGVSTTSKVVATGKGLSVCVGPELLGRVLDGLGQPIDGLGPIKSGRFYPIDAPSPDPLNRKTVKEVLPVGIRTIDGLITCGKGQRMGIFAGSGVGKSSLLGMMARNTKADLNVIALVGERGREVREFLENDLGEEGLKRSVVVVATSDKPPLVRLKAAMVATTITEYFRDQGADVLFLLDSLTRVATAGREVGLTVGEPPTTRGYTPSVFAFLPKLLERAGSGSRGTTTAFYTVLVEGDDMDEPVADAVRSILDGHIVLSRSLAERGHYPAIDVLASVSRVMTYVSSKEHQSLAMEMKRILATYKEAEDLINIGAYARGSNPEIDRAITTIDRINKFLIQPVDEKISFEETLGLMEQVLEDRGQNNEEVRV